MTTGTVLDNGGGPQGPNNQAGAGVDNGNGGSSLLSGLVTGAQTFNASILEFDFIPYSDTVRFKYVFGSDEYPEFAPPNNSSYNDVFGFFISGPGIVGMQNIAKLPNNGSIVSINNVNAVTNSQFYNFNGDGTSSPYNSSTAYIQYDGFTDVLTAESKVQCGQTYHLIVAIADVGDGKWDSGIFLEANSLSSKTPITITHELSQSYYSNPDWMAEGCVSATVEISRENNINTVVTIPVQVSGNASNGTDYIGVPTSITLGAGQSTTSFTLNALFDNVPEGIETLTLTFPLVDPCGNINPVVINLFIQDVEPLSVVLNNPTIECPGDDITLSASISGGLPQYTYLWNTGATQTTIQVTPLATGNYWVKVNDACLGAPAYDTVLVTVPQYLPIAVMASSDITEICPYLSKTLYAQANGGSGNYSYKWFRGTQLISQADSVVVKPSATTTYIVQVVDNCGSIAYDTVVYTITSPPLIVSISPNIELCPGDSTFITASATGGYGNHYFSWNHNGDTTQGVWVKPSGTYTYSVVVKDECQTFSVSAFVLVKIIKPEADFMPISQNMIENLPISFLNLTTNGYEYEWFFGDGGQSSVINPAHVYDTAGTYYVTLVAWDSKGCVDTITKPITIFKEFYIYIPNSFIPDEDRINNFFVGSFIGVKWIKMEIFNRWGELLFYSEDQNFKWDGTFNNQRVPDGTYTWKLSFRPIRGTDELMTGHVNVLR